MLGILVDTTSLWLVARLVSYAAVFVIAGQAINLSMKRHKRFDACVREMEIYEEYGSENESRY